jgi:hypothetical protein
VQDFLEHFGIGNEAFALTDEFFEQSLGICFMGMGRTDQMHGDVRVA